MSNSSNLYTGEAIRRDLLSGIVVFLVALPLCLGIALASNAPMISGLIAGIVGGLVVGALSGSHTSVSGPAAGLAAIVVVQLDTLGSFSAFTLCVTLAGAIQIGLGAMRAGFLASFFPSSVIKGLLAAIGVLLILKQFPHMLGHDPDPVGEMDFAQPDGENTFSELVATMFDIHLGAATIGLLSVVLIIAWQRLSFLKKSGIPAPLVVVGMGLGLSEFFAATRPSLAIEASHLVQMPVVEGLAGFAKVLEFPDWSQLANPAVYVGAVTIAIVATLETLLNLEAVDKIDPEKRHSPPNRELFAQGAGNMVSGLIGGLPITSVIVRSSVNVNTKNKTRLSAIFHAIFLVIALVLIPDILNRIPLSCLAAILLMTGFKLASPDLFKRMWSGGRTQFMPFIATILAIVLIDLLIGVLIGLGVSALFILYSNFKRPLRKVMEHHVAEDVLRVRLANQVSFFSRASLENTLEAVPKGGHVLLDATDTEYLDPDVLELIQEYKSTTGPARGVNVSLVGFKEKYANLADDIQFVDFTTQDVQAQITPPQVLEILRQGNARFRKGDRIRRTLIRQAQATSGNQAPLAVILCCADSVGSAEHIFDLGIGEAYVVRVAGNVAGDRVIGSIEYGCVIAGAKLIMVLGHTSCGAVGTAVELFGKAQPANEITGCATIAPLIGEIQASLDPKLILSDDADADERAAAMNEIARANVLHTMSALRDRSETLRHLIESGSVGLVGGLHEIHTGEVKFMDPNLDGVTVVVAERRPSVVRTAAP